MKIQSKDTHEGNHVDNDPQFFSDATNERIESRSFESCFDGIHTAESLIRTAVSDQDDT